MRYYVIFSNEQNNFLNIFGTLSEAKTKATKAISYGCGDVAIHDVFMKKIAERTFWKDKKDYGWTKWKLCEDLNDD